MQFIVNVIFFYICFTLNRSNQMAQSTAYKSLEKNIKIPTQMKAITVDENTKKLVLNNVSIPKLRSQEVLIQIKASAVNRADLLQASGKYPPPKGESTIIGLECSGIIVDYSNDCKIAGKSKKFDIGAKVMALLPGGGYVLFLSNWFFLQNNT